MLLHPYPDKNYRAKVFRYLKIWLLLGLLLSVFGIMYAVLGEAKAEARKLSLNNIMEYTKDVAKCVRKIQGISWDSNQEPNLAYYNVYRGEADTKEILEWSFLGNTEHTKEKRLFFKLGRDDRKKIYAYRVTAVDIHGTESEPSKIISCLKQ